MQVNILEAKNQLSKLVKAAAAGKEVVIASNGKPMAKLVAITPPRRIGGAWMVHALSDASALGELTVTVRERRVTRVSPRSIRGRACAPSANGCSG